MLLAGQPAINPRGVLNAASLAPAGLPSGSIAKGSIFSIFGTNLGPVNGVKVSAFPIAQALAGVSIQATQGATAVAVLPLYVSATQINALMPSNAPLGQLSLRVSFNNQSSNPSTVTVVNSSFGIFSLSEAGFGPGVFFNFVSNTNRPLNSLQVTASPGQVVTMYGTGLGPANGPDNLQPTPGNLSTPVGVTVGGQPAKVLYSGRSPCCSGLDQIDFQVPANASLGCWVPVYVQTDNAITSNATTMAIDQKGAACPIDPVSKVFTNGGKVGVLYLVRNTVHEDVGVSTVTDITSDALVFDLAQHNGSASNVDFFPPAGSCTLYASVGDWLGTGQISGTSYPVKLLDAGTFSITGPKGQITPPIDPGVQATRLGTYWTASGFQDQSYLDPGSYQISASGGDISAFQVNLTVPAAFLWTNRDQFGSIDRTQPLIVSWSGVTAGQQIALEGAATDLPTNSSAVFVCTASPGANSLTVPPSILAALPATRPSVSRSKAALFLTSVPFSNAKSITLTGLDAAIATSVYTIGKTVSFR